MQMLQNQNPKIKTNLFEKRRLDFLEKNSNIGIVNMM
jgi:hypothetical protein